MLLISALGRTLRLCLALCLAGALSGRPAVAPAAAAPAGGPTFVVDRIDDVLVSTCDGAPNDCSLRGAIERANQTTGATVQLAYNQTYVLSDVANGDLDLTANMTILPAGPCGAVTCHTLIQGAPGWADRLLDVSASVVISGLTLLGGSSAEGGGIRTSGALAVYDARVISNTTTGQGGGLYNLGGALILVRTEVGFNRAQVTGGGLANQGGQVTLQDSQVISNTAYGEAEGQGRGGGLSNLNSLDQLTQGVLAITHTTILTNSTPITFGWGGGLYNLGRATLVSSTVSSNLAYYGGGLESYYYIDEVGPLVGLLTLTATQVVSNTAVEEGGGLRNSTPVFITDSLFAGNRQVGTGGGGGLSSGGTMHLVDSLLYNNSGWQGGGLRNTSIFAQAWLTNTDVLSNSAHTGGGLAVTGALTLTSGSRVNHNLSDTDGGGAGVNYLGRLTALPGTQFSDNVLFGAKDLRHGAGIANSGVLLLDGALLSGNQALTGAGGGLHTYSGGLTVVTDTLIAANQAVYGGGGVSNAGVTRLTTSAIYQNTTPANGGGIENTYQITLTNVTVSGNEAGYGGGVSNSGVLRQQFVTIAVNTAITGAGGIQNTNVYSTGSSLIAGNLGPTADCAATLLSAGHNLLGNSTGCLLLGGSADLADADPRLLPLALVNGTRVHGLWPDSPARDAADPLTCPAIDQAHHSRPVGAGCDIGAFESANFSIFYLFLPLVVR